MFMTISYDEILLLIKDDNLYAKEDMVKFLVLLNFLNISHYTHLNLGICMHSDSYCSLSFITCLDYVSLEALL